ncbi:MAG: 16S rRNA (guanine(966)-N(2))-methyltransferase RsmD [Firmicutes bacterium]|nr:16S rRNA (guanine(966)-N(2))-methyltransferase RsmD [Bacillota bacterium]
MRVISGKYKGRSLDGHKIAGTRPTMDRVKESMFAMIQNKVSNAVCLDLFSGSGNLGIEAISNGASKVYFVDFNQICIQTIEKNLRTLQITEEAIVMKKDYLEALRYLKERGMKMDIIFLDPPYKYHFMDQILEELEQYQICNQNCYIICETDKEETIETTLTLLKEKRYGDKYVRIYQKEA